MKEPKEWEGMTAEADSLILRLNTMVDEGRAFGREMKAKKAEREKKKEEGMRRKAIREGVEKEIKRISNKFKEAPLQSVKEFMAKLKEGEFKK